MGYVPRKWKGEITMQPLLAIGSLLRASSPDRLRSCSLDALMDSTGQLQEIRKKDLNVGDRVFVKTLRSVYCLQVMGGGRYSVSGGWFDAKGNSPALTTICGCTWGGSVIKVDVVAACGLCIEFGNRVTTSVIQAAVVLPAGREN